LLQHRKGTPRISRDGGYCWEFSRNTASGLPDYAFDALISRGRVLGFDSLLLSDPDGEVCADDSNEKVQAPDVEPALWPQPQSVGEACRHSPGVKTGLAPLGGNGLFLSAG
jgi:hypothetical protein